MRPVLVDIGDQYCSARRPVVVTFHPSRRCAPGRCEERRELCAGGASVAV
ncbi:hypothetical protein HMPREF3185_01150 [Porphyromonas somerae]|uniref:Uncharacterized protein n=1 Tax=Porphyromonas somerae TaxID=322095 RepID=A0A134B840_9PORP|nr:hypothetical protein HMPREF3184_01150 [Porphyromonadaceae bacterium KA00676]KXB76101.1 hypothetical protein HMPREF3185_01150 [Porphyromonas somerae]